MAEENVIIGKFTNFIENSNTDLKWFRINFIPRERRNTNPVEFTFHFACMDGFINCTLTVCIELIKNHLHIHKVENFIVHWILDWN